MNRMSLLILCAVLAAIGGAYLLGRAGIPRPPAAARDAGIPARTAAPGPPAAPVRAPPAARPADDPAAAAPLPAPGTPLRETFTSLQARANAGDVAAARRLVGDLSRCRALAGAEWKSAGAAETLTGRDIEQMGAAQLRTYQHLLDAMELRQQALREDQTLCAGAGDGMLASLVANLAQAAKLGDAIARACYLERGPLLDAGHLFEQPQALQAYRADARALIEAGLAEGDWRVVDLLQQAYQPGAQGLLAGLVGADPARHYRYLKLYRLGAERHRSAGLDRRLAAASASLTREQIAAAEAWADAAFRGFSGSSTTATPPGWEPCPY